MKPKISIITPTILEPTLARTCKSIDRQKYDSYEHLVVIDLPDTKITSIPLNLLSTKRRWFICDKRHGAVGNFCRNWIFPHIAGDWVFYCDSDDYFLDVALATVVDAIDSQGDKIDWGVFPIRFLGQRYLNVPPGIERSNICQMFHRKYIKGIPIQYIANRHYTADGEMMEDLKRLADPYILDCPKMLAAVDTTSSREQAVKYGKFTLPEPMGAPVGRNIITQIPEMEKIMHDSVMRFLKLHVNPEDVASKRVLEVGSIFWQESPRDVIMPHGPGFYFGVDRRPGKGVDLVVNSDTAIRARFDAEWVHTIVCTEVLEHAEDWRSLVNTIKSLLAPGGTLFLTARGPGYPRHEEPTDHWRFTVDDFRAIFEDMSITVLEQDPDFPGVFLKAYKRSGQPIDLTDIEVQEA
jgi:glycosyltransferase involved in cell wall biosynthesis